jgi:hypothetical protein
MRLALPVASYVDPPSSSTRLVNAYIEQGGEQGKGPVLNGSPGISEHLEVGDVEIRASFQMFGVLYVVALDKFYKVSGSTVTLIGTVGFGARPQIAGNGIQVCVLINPNAYVYTLSTGALSQITDPDFTARGASSVQFFDNFLTFTEPNSGRWYSSDLTNATSFDSLNFSTAEGAPDNLLAHVVDHRQAFLLGTESCELWDNAGIAGFPFVRAANGFVELGCLNGATAVKVDQSVFWLASDGTVRRLQGITPRRISTHAVERAIKGYTISGGYGLTITWDGHIWYVLTFPEGTWIYDVTTQKWHERRSYGYDNWRASCAAQLNGVTYVGDSQSNKLGILDDVFAEFGDVLRMEWTYPPIYGEGASAIHDRLEIMFEAGVGIASGQGSDPYVSLEISDDGKTFREAPIKRLGKIGEYRQRAVWHRLGQSRNRVYRAYISDPIRRKVVDTQAEVVGGRL